MKLNFKETQAEELNAGFWQGVGIGIGGGVIIGGLIVLT